MNWIIRSTKKLKFHTDLHEVLKPIWSDLAIYKWILTDLDFISNQPLPINFDEDYFVLDHPEFEQLYKSNTQIIWGIMNAIPADLKPDTSLISHSYADDPLVWESNQFAFKESVLEIIAFDSSYTIVKFRDKNLSDKFKEYFQEQAIDLQKFNETYIK